MQVGGNSDCEALLTLAADLRGRMEASTGFRSDMKSVLVGDANLIAAKLVSSEAGQSDGSTHSNDCSAHERCDASDVSPSRKASIASVVNESLEQFRNTLSQEHVRTVDLVKHWAKVASESKRVCMQIAEKLQGSHPNSPCNGDVCTIPAAEAMLREGLREAVEGLRIEFKGALDSLEGTIFSKAVAAISSEAQSCVQKEAAAALDKVLEVEGRTLEAWTREFDFARSELSRQAGQLSFLEERLIKKVMTEDELPQQTLFLGQRGEDNQTSGSCDVMCSPTPMLDCSGASADVSQRSSIQSWDEASDQMHALGIRLARVEDKVSSILHRTVKQSHDEACLRKEVDELVERIQSLVPSEMEEALERLQQLQGPSIALRQQLERMLEEHKDSWLREVASREAGDYRVETVCEHKLTNLELSLLDLTRKLQSQAELLTDVEETAANQQAERDEKQQAFSEAVQTTLKMLIQKMDEMSSSGAQLCSPTPPPPFPIRSRSPEAFFASVPSPITSKPFVSNVRRITSAPAHHPQLGNTSAMSRSASDKMLPQTPFCEWEANHTAEQLTSTLILSSSSTSVPGTPDVVLSGGGGTVSSVPCTEAVHTVGIPEDEPVLWAPRSRESPRARSVSPMYTSTSRAQANAMEDAIALTSQATRRMVSLSPGRTSRSPIGSQLLPVGTLPAWANSLPAPTARSPSPIAVSSKQLGLVSSRESCRPRSSSPTICRTMQAAPHLYSPGSVVHSASSSASAPVGVTLAPLSPGLRARSGTARFGVNMSASAPSSATAPATVTRLSSSPSRIPSAILGPSRNPTEGGSARQSLSPSPKRQRDQVTMSANVAAVLLPIQANHH